MLVVWSLIYIEVVEELGTEAILREHTLYHLAVKCLPATYLHLSLIHISEPTRRPG